MTCDTVVRTVSSPPHKAFTSPAFYFDKQGELTVNLSDRLAKAAQDRRREHEASRTTVGSFTSEAMIDFDSTRLFLLPDTTADPVDANHVEPMKMRLPDLADEAMIEAGPLPLWERPLVDILHDAPLATVTSLPIVPHVDVADEDLEGFELAQPIPMRGARMPADVEVDLDELHVPPLAVAESGWLAGIALRSEQPHHEDVIDLTSDDVAVDAAQRPRITFGPLDVHDVAVHASVAAEHLCPQCGAAARIDIHDPMRGRIHLSCHSCYKMWQEKVESTVNLDEPFMRD
jgi:hypothetical protein